MQRVYIVSYHTVVAENLVRPLLELRHKRARSFYKLLNSRRKLRHYDSHNSGNKRSNYNQRYSHAQRTHKAASFYDEIAIVIAYLSHKFFEQRLFHKSHRYVDDKCDNRAKYKRRQYSKNKSCHANQHLIVKYQKNYQSGKCNGKPYLCQSELFHTISPFVMLLYYILP